MRSASSASPVSSVLSAATVLVLALVLGAEAPADAAPGSSSSSSSPSDTSSGPVFRAATQVGPDASSVNFSWRTSFSGPEVVRIYPDGSPERAIEVPGREVDFGAIAYRSRFAEVTGLEPGVAYSYQIGSEAGGWSAPETVTIDDGDDHWRFVAVTDAQIGVGARISEQARTWRETAARAAEQAPDASLFVSLGDQVEGWGDLIGTLGQYNAYFSAPQLRRYRFAAIEGNHETYPSSLATRHFKEHWDLPNEQGDTSNYFFEQNNALFIALNSNRKDDAGLAEQAQFVREAASAHGSDKDWVIVLNHFAFHSHGGRYTDEDIVRMRETLSPVFSEVGVDLVLNGHDHMYNRSHLMNGLSPRVPNAPAAPGDVLEKEDGEVLYLTFNTAGGGKYYDFEGNDGKEYPGMTLEQAREAGLNQPTIALWNQDYTPDYSVVEVDGDALNVRSYNTFDGSLVDDVTLSHSAVDAPGDGQPEAPTGGSSEAAAGIGIAAAVIGAIGIVAALVGNLPQLAERFGITL
ncbi:purple acid phosphatase family protein [Corynebacterium liangguodongii]|uniref:Phosphohydrolase n=1 Tax=Corynebacterium liangguodongii TaxID=2079535 RepID=A0A2S0WDB4_9CORY|nr:metallophosphoesterase family protein [Corynebacterium liangguodongii]AWB83759.1 phosphohydrolase [Corynebacterium liangguodongii]PWB99431.1 phosphohydrolase [Corynebacterium liangguodongii]